MMETPKVVYLRPFLEMWLVAELLTPPKRVMVYCVCVVFLLFAQLLLYSYVENGLLNRVDANGHASGASNVSAPVLHSYNSDDVWNCSVSHGHACTGAEIEAMVSAIDDGTHTSVDTTNDEARDEEAYNNQVQVAQQQAAAQKP